MYVFMYGAVSGLRKEQAGNVTGLIISLWPQMAESSNPL